MINALNNNRVVPIGFSNAAPKIPEEVEIHLTGLPIDAQVVIGRTVCDVKPDGSARLEHVEEGHGWSNQYLGFIPIYVNGEHVGDVERVPSKVSPEQYHTLRSDLLRTWRGLIFNPDSATYVQVPSPSARMYWERIATAVRDIMETPAQRLDVATVLRHPDLIRHGREMTAAALRAEDTGGRAAIRTLEASSDVEENYLVAATLRMLRDRASQDDSLGDLESELTRLLVHELFRDSVAPLTNITWGMRADDRYAAVLDVYLKLRSDDPNRVWGPTELEMGGIDQMPRLYEYWVFLQVLLAAKARFGDPLGDGFDVLSTPTDGSRRLELAPNTEVWFPGDVVVVFEPQIDVKGGWRDLYPAWLNSSDTDRKCPDVMVMREGAQPAAIVFDAKYTAAHLAHQKAQSVWKKYAHIARGSHGVVRQVMVAYPSGTEAKMWAGYGYVPFIPGEPVNIDAAFDLLGVDAPAAVTAPAAPAGPVEMPDAAVVQVQPVNTASSPAQPPTLRVVPPPPSAPGTPQNPFEIYGDVDNPDAEVGIIVDQQWFNSWRRNHDSRTVDFGRLKAQYIGRRKCVGAYVVGPEASYTEKFFDGVERRGWMVQPYAEGENSERDEIVARLARDILDNGYDSTQLLVVTGDLHVRRVLPDDRRVVVVSDVVNPPWMGW